MVDLGGVPRWVKGRADCNVALNFEALKDIVKRDVGDINSLPEENLKGFKFEFQAAADGLFYFRVYRVHHDRHRYCEPDFVTITKGVSSIDFEGNGDFKDFQADPKWDEKNCACRMYVDNQPFELWELSQKALSSLFFVLPS